MSEAPRQRPYANWVDRVIEFFAPHAAVRRAAARTTLAYYDVAKPSRLRQKHADNASPNNIAASGAIWARSEARYLDRNHDIARGILRTQVNNIVGPNGIGVEPTPRRKDGTIHEEYAKALLALWHDWCKLPEVTRRHRWGSMNRLMARTWLRDGEALAQELMGWVPKLDHGTKVPYSLEMIEPDLVPFDLNDEAIGIRQGIELNGWGRARAFYVYKQHPGEQKTFKTAAITDMRVIPAQRMRHIAVYDRIGQVRGVSEFASIITRLQDNKDYEESERVAAKIAAMMTAYVKRGNPELYDPARPAAVDENGQPKPRELIFKPGMIIDGLAVGEDIGMIDTKRPNPNVLMFRQGQLRAAAAGFGASYSSISRDYDGTYSSQRQELVEQWVNYATLCDEFVGMFVQPTYESFVWIADASGVLRTPRDVVPETADDALFVGQSMPWIDPLKEAEGWMLLVQAGFASEVEVMRKRGVNPWDVLEQLDQFRKKAQEKGLTLSSDAANDKGAAAASAAPAQEPQQNTGRQRASRSRATAK